MLDTSSRISQDCPPSLAPLNSVIKSLVRTSFEGLEYSSLAFFQSPAGGWLLFCLEALTSGAHLEVGIALTLCS